MKKLALSVILGASLAMATSSFALTSMDDENMKSITAQAGVSIAIDNVVIEQYIGSTSYSDDGVTLADGVTQTAGGSIIIGEQHSVQGFYSLPANGVDVNGVPLQTNTFYENAMAAIVNQLYAAEGISHAALTAADFTAKIGQSAPLTIDVGICPILSAGEYTNANPMDMSTPANYLAATTAAIGSAAHRMTGVIIGLGSMAMTTSSSSYEISACSATGVGASNDNAVMITVSSGPSVTAILSGSVEIAAH